MIQTGELKPPALYGPSPLYGTISFPPIPRFCVRSLFPHAALPCLAPFPPAALPAFSGTTGLSDSLYLICLPPSSVVRHTLDFLESGTGPPGFPHNPDVKHAMVSDPGKADISLPFAAISVLTSTVHKVSSFPSRRLRGSIPSTFRLTACLLAVLRLKRYVTIAPPRTCYPVAGSAFRGGLPTRWITRPCPAAREGRYFATKGR